jgi:hypothetical protein
MIVNSGQRNPRFRTQTHQNPHSLQKVRPHELPPPEAHLLSLWLPRCPVPQVRLVAQDPAEKGHWNWQDEIHQDHPQDLQKQNQEPRMINPI